MRNIKFRGFSISAKRWIYGYAWIVPEVNLYYILTGKINVRDCSVEKYEVYPESVGQYTGLKDSNNKMIFEGDIVQFTWDSDSCWGKAGTYIGYIRFDSGAFEVVYIGKVRERRFREGTECFDDLKSFMDWSEEVKVIGNIY